MMRQKESTTQINSGLDDGGSEKSSKRLYRRKAIKLGKLFSSLIALVLVGYLVIILTGEQNQNDANRPRTSSTSGSGSRPVSSQSQSKYRWVDDRHLPPLPGTSTGDFDKLNWKRERSRENWSIKRKYDHFPWEDITDPILLHKGPTVDYKDLEYEYPDVILNPPTGGIYPQLETLGTLLQRWPQNHIDSPPEPFIERLQHFDFSDPIQRQAAERYRDLELPFKVYNVLELDIAHDKWTDEYLSFHFDRNASPFLRGGQNDRNQMKQLEQKYGKIPRTRGHCQQSVDSYFAFYSPDRWYAEDLGDAPTLDNDFTFARWAQHARYADSVGLDSHQEHFYFQSGVPPSERWEDEEEWTFVSRDLPSFSSPNPTFFGFNPKEQKGIQCRFGERGVTAATHYDAGRNMVAMITGAKRYILAPPKECSKLALVVEKAHPSFRHSMLNFDHIDLLHNQDPILKEMPEKERKWLEIAKDSLAIETVLKAGEVLYIPSHWFHYIISLQKSAQCNTRSGRHVTGSKEFGGFEDVMKCEQN